MLSHLLELRRRLLHVILFFLVLFCIFFFYANNLFHALVKPLLSALSKQDTMIATQITSPVLIPIKLAANTAMLCSAPFALLQLWCFAAPGLYKKERFHIRNAIITSLLLFCLGILFCFYLILPYMFQFFAKSVPEGVHLMPDMAETLDFITRMLLLFGVCFQVPLLCLTVVRLGWVELAVLKKIRPYIIVAAFIVGMLLTPPDVLSQIMLAVPLCLLYELGIFLAARKTYSSTGDLSGKDIDNREI
ncbi:MULTISPECIES: twin-arginine translocase subunit TatC [Legionella]|uniref:Sec-independent protein translocase protein TatC n=1 Tax=Legionella drozanskii LLAP-1 TaxID=1212489 RepID=A0A0W0SN67_9GAMM|nr:MULTISPECIES: twin-arginine translocase subunit TatC [Legionella]KTC84665.1 sec-independent (periplasmic) protein translocase protein TatC [Legionella drozanskii LLAP-1]PJE07904.1 MAG: twin-arginine translocase subunit TatC [Legionella sp.]